MVEIGTGTTLSGKPGQVQKMVDNSSGLLNDRVVIFYYPDTGARPGTLAAIENTGALIVRTEQDLLALIAPEEWI